MKRATQPALRLDDLLCFAIYSAAHAFNRAYKPLLDELGLTYPQFLAMMVLWERDRVPLKDIGRRLQLDSGTLTPLLKRLAAAGLIERGRDPLDERQVVIALTPKGRALQEKAAAAPHRLAVAARLPAREIARTRADLIRLRDALNDAVGGA